MIVEGSSIEGGQLDGDVNNDKPAERTQDVPESLCDARTENVVPTRFEIFFVRRPCCAFWLFFGLALLGSAVFVWMILTGVLTFTNDHVWIVRSDIRVEQYHAVDAVRRVYNERQTQRVEEQGLLDSMRDREHYLDSILFYYESEDDVFSEEHLKHIANLENILARSEEWHEFCVLVYEGNISQCAGGGSMLTVSAGVPNDAEETEHTVLNQLKQGFGKCSTALDVCQSNNLTIGEAPCQSTIFDPLHPTLSGSLKSNYRQYLRCLCCAEKPDDTGCDYLFCSNAGDIPFCGLTVDKFRVAMRKSFIGEDMSCATGKASLAWSRYKLGYPLKSRGFNEASLDSVNDQRHIILEWSRGKLRRELSAEMDKIMDVTDGKLQVYVVGAGIGQAEFDEAIILDQLNAIGAIFAVWLWLYMGTGSAFLATCGLLEIILSLPLACVLWGLFGMEIVTGFMLGYVFLILGVGADDVFVLHDAWVQAAALYPGVEDGNPEKRFAFALRRARSAMTVTSATTLFSQIAAGASPIPSISAFGIFGALVVLLDYLLVISFFAASLVIRERYLSGCVGPVSLIQRCFGLQCQASGERSQKRALRSVEQFFHDRWAPFVYRRRYIIICFWTVMFVVGVTVPSLYLRLSEDEPRFWHDRRLARWTELSGGKGIIKDSGSTKIRISVFFGLRVDKPIDRSGTNYQDKHDTGKAVFDPDAAAALVSPAGQQEIWQMCEDARVYGVHGYLAKDTGCSVQYIGSPPVAVEVDGCQTGVSCFIDLVKDYQIYANGRNESNWYAENLSDVLNDEKYYAYLAHVDRVRSQHGLYIPFREWSNIGFWRPGVVDFAMVTFNSTLRLEFMPLEELRPHFDAWENFVTRHLVVNRGFQTSKMWLWMSTQEGLLTSAMSAFAGGLALVWMILCISTANWVVATLCSSCVIVILVDFALMIVLAGWQLGVFEAVGFIVVVGLSVDYTVHIGHAYNEVRVLNGRMGSRVERTTHALTEMGVSVLSGAATTMAASLFLIPGKFNFYFYLGIFMATTVTLSLSVALTLLPALLYVFGPVDSVGDMSGLSAATLKAKSLCCRLPFLLIFALVPKLKPTDSAVEENDSGVADKSADTEVEVEDAL